MLFSLDSSSNIIRDLPLVLLIAFSFFSACHAILHKRDPRSGLGWLLACLFFIGVGPCLYWLFGVNRIQTHAKKLLRLGHWKHGTQTARADWVHQLSGNQSFHAEDFQGLLQVSEKVNRHPLMIGNKIEILHNGEEAYPAMLRSIGEAQKFIYFCSYIFQADETGLRFIKALKSAQERGVKVWVLVDAFGEHYSRPAISHLLKKEGIPCARYMPLSLSLNSLHFNLRNHRKSLVIDGQIGFTGGMNIRQKHFTDLARNEAIQDVHFKIEGPVVLELQEVFLEDWFFATKESLEWLARPHDLLPGNMICRAVVGGPNEDFEKINWILLGALAWAKKRVQIMTPYFVPDRIMITALITTALRGVPVEIILPEKSNLPFTAWASRALLAEMLENGIRIFYQPSPFAHTKLFVVDGEYSVVGSSNWDARSLRLNFELDLEVYDTEFARTLSAHFDKILGQSRNVTSEEMEKESLLARFRNSLSRLFSPYL